MPLGSSRIILALSASSFKLIGRADLLSVSLLGPLIFILFITGVFEQLSQYKTVSIVFMNVQEGGFKKSTGRSSLFESSAKEVIEHPLGVGSGNFIEYTDKSTNKSFPTAYVPEINYTPSTIFC